MTNFNTSSSIVELPPIEHPDAWEAPVLFENINTPDIPASLLPDCLGEFATALATATETPEALSVMTILGVVSSAIAHLFRVNPFAGYFEPINIYTMTVLPPANNKSLITNSCTKPLTDYEREQQEILEPLIKQQTSERKTQERIIENLRSKAAKTEDTFEQQQLIKEITDKETALIISFSISMRT